VSEEYSWGTVWVGAWEGSEGNGGPLYGNSALPAAATCAMVGEPLLLVLVLDMHAAAEGGGSGPRRLRPADSMRLALAHGPRR
jgi:hypothetical protein